MLWILSIKHFNGILLLQIYHTKIKLKSKTQRGNSLEVQWLGLHASIAGGMGSIFGRETKIPQAAWHGQEKKKRERQKSRNVMERKGILASSPLPCAEIPPPVPLRSEGPTSPAAESRPPGPAPRRRCPVSAGSQQLARPPASSAGSAPSW